MKVEHFIQKQDIIGTYVKSTMRRGVLRQNCRLGLEYKTAPYTWDKQAGGKITYSFVVFLVRDLQLAQSSVSCVLLEYRPHDRLYMATRARRNANNW